ncbi:MAG: phosphatase PAP2 family protein [Chloroflexi bacterium]|nr:phosphatase PAP2 family protein [Chloroflexota bacterium]
MEAVWQSGLDFITWLQTTYPQLEGFFFFITDLGREEFYLAVLPLIYWVINKRLGKYLGAVFFFTVMVNGIFKQAFRGPRPFWIDSAVGLDNRETSYGIPSGHTMNGTIVYLFIAAWIGKRWVWAVAVIMVFLMGLSRIYLGAHFPTDVIAGLLLALLILGSYAFWARRYRVRFEKRILGQRLMIAILVPVILGLLFIAVRFLIGSPGMTVIWASFIPAAEVSSILSIAQAFGLLLGFSVGAVLEGSKIRFRVDGPIWQRTIRYIVGLVVLVGLWFGLGQLFPRDPLTVAIPLRILRYFIVALWAAYYAPWVFVKLHLASADPEPEIDISLR